MILRFGPTHRPLGSVMTGLAALLALMETSSATIACPAPPPPVKDISLPRFYGDQAGSVVDAKLAEAHKQAVAPLTSFLRHVTQDADKALRRSKPEAQAEVGTCAVAWLAAWAKGEAWLGKMETKQAEYQRKWDLAGAALAYLKVRRFATPEQRAVIEPWLIKFADTARAFFDDAERKRNNHWYWLGLAVGAVGLAADSPRHWEMARGIMQDAAADVGPDGTIQHEVERKGRALHYHAFSAMPLVVLAELAQSKGEDWYAFGDGAVHRLVGVTLEGLARPELFQKIAGAAQDAETSHGAGWYILYHKRFPSRAIVKPDNTPEGHRWLGGNVLVLLDALRKP